MRLLLLVSVFLMVNVASAEEIISVKSRYNFSKTVAALKTQIDQKNFKLFSEIDHRKGALSAGLKMEVNTLLIFGKPKGGTPLMQENPLMGLELPLKLLVFQSKDKRVMVSFKDPRSFLKKYGLKNNSKRLEKIFTVLDSIARSVSKNKGGI